MNVATDPIEEELGITAYLSPEIPGFSAVLKARYSDFVVHEVGCDGTVARLTCMEPRLLSDPPIPTTDQEPPEKEPPEQDAAHRKRKRDNDKQEQASELPRAQPDWPTLQTGLAALVGGEASTEALQFLQRMEEIPDSHSPEEPQGQKDSMDPERLQQFHVALPPVSDKEMRRTIHQWVREHLAGIARSDTIDMETSQTDKVIRIWHQRYTRMMPNWKAFEQNRNNQTRENERGKTNKPPPGMKFLRFVLYKENMDTTHAINQLGRVNGRKLRIGYAGMKDKRGITSQFVTVPASTPIHGLARWNTSQNHRGGGHTKSQGIGVLRVGNFEYVSEDLRMGRLLGNRFDVALRNVQLEGVSLSDMKVRLERAALSLKENGFINYFGVQRFGKFHDTHLTGIEVIKENYERAIDIIMQPKPNEPHYMTTMREEWRKRFDSAADKDAAERECAIKLVKNVNRNLSSSEASVLNSLARYPLDYKRAYGCVQKTMRMMFVHAVQSYLWNHAASFRIHKFGRRVVKGDLVAGASDDKFSVRVVTEHDLVADRYKLEDVLLPMIGAKTQLPENEVADHYHFLMQQIGISQTEINKLDEREFDLCGDYRNMICPSAELDYKIIEYTDPLQPLIQTDLMKLQSIDIKEASDSESTQTLLAMDVGFRLPSSTYATIALRELMKRPTSSEYQSELKLENK